MALEAISKEVLTFLLSGIGGTVLLLLPGYLLMGTYGRGLRGPAPSERAFIAGTAGASTVVHLIALPWTVRLGEAVLASGHRGQVGAIAAWVLVVVLVVPVALGAGAATLSDLDHPRWLVRLLTAVGLSSTVRTAEAWNWVFRQGFPAYVRVHLKDGDVVLGWYGGKSFASSDAANGDLYLQEQWQADANGWFAEPLKTSRGVWLRGSEIVSIEFFAGQDPTD